MENEIDLEKVLEEIKNCCHHGHGASVFANGDVMQAINENDVIAHSTPGGWEYRIGYIDNPDVAIEDVKYLFESEAIS